MTINPCKICGCVAHIVTCLDSAQIICDNGKHYTKWYLRYTPWGDCLNWDYDIIKEWNDANKKQGD